MSAPEGSPAKAYKDTLNLPRTEFPMKGNLGQLEPRLLGYWAEQRIYERLVDSTREREPFVLHDGPPYANGRLHAGHALNKVLKDIVVKFQNLSGRHTEFIPGWDCHGLPIEQAVEKRLREKKIDKRTLSRDELLEHCRAYALEFVEVQREEFKRLGVFGRWEAPYLTLSFDYEAQEIRELATFARRGALYRRKKPVYWCITDQTALAEAEVEYEEHVSPQVYVAMAAAEDLGGLSAALSGKGVSFVIWTTTPWTLPANLAIAVHPKLEYVFYALGERVLCVAKELLLPFLAQVAPEELQSKEVALGEGQKFEAKALVEPARIVAYALGKDLEGLGYRHPFVPRTSKLILAEHVTLEAGTGLVHTAPGHGQEDYEVGLRYGLDIYNPVRPDGRYDDTVPERLRGLKVWDANPLIVQWLVELGALLNAPGQTVRHSYAHCWRCRNPIIYAGTWQWFISLEHNDLRKKALAEIDRVKWVPRWGRDRIYNMLENRPDWCISRQRAWGVPIPAAFCEGCEEAVVSAELMEQVAQAVEQHGAGIWYRTPVTDFLPTGFCCPKCGGRSFRQETDILDVWFDSAASFAAVADKREGLRLPVDLYLEGSDQHRGWFHSSMLVGVGTRDRSPYETCLTHGFVVDGEGRKMSKSMGNVVAPEQIIKQYGAEILRLWVASSDYRDDVRLSDQILKGLSEGYRKIRNTVRYALSNLYDFDPGRDEVAVEALRPLDRWALHRLSELVAKVRRAYEAYEFHLVYHHVVDFCAMDLSATYFDILKDRLYTAAAHSPERRSAQMVLFAIASDLLRLLAPVMSFTAEEAFQHLPGKKGESVFLAGFPVPPPPAPPELLLRYEQLFAVRAEIQKLLEAVRRDKLIGASLEARLSLYAEGKAKALLQAQLAELPSLFIVSQVELLEAPPPNAQPLSLQGAFGEGAKVAVLVEAARGQKCPRCWNYSEAISGEQPLCPRCQAALLNS
jgi:isoleucyl-tRNA synthetase